MEIDLHPRGLGGWLDRNALGVVRLGVEARQMERLTKLQRWLMGHWWLGFLLLLAPPVFWAADRDAPFSVLAYIEPPAARPGESVVFVLPVRRDLSRGCNVKYTRFIIDSSGVRHEYSEAAVSAQGLKRMDKAMGPFVRVAMTVPAGAAPGPATLMTELSYRCNPLNVLWPIPVSLSWPFQVLDVGP